MAKWAICDAQTGQLNDICDEEDKFEIYEGPDAGCKWVPVPDDCTYEHRMINGVCVHRVTQKILEKSNVLQVCLLTVISASNLTCSMQMQRMVALLGRITLIM